MLFYRTSPDYRLATRGGVAARGGFLPGAASSADSAATLRATWMIKSFVTGIALLGLAYWLVQIAGAQYLATLTSATLLSFLLVYIVWCLTVKRRHHPQSTDSVVTAESVSGPTVSIRPPAPLNPALKHYGVPPRECSPPPSYEEVLRQMSAAAAAGSNAPTVYEDTVATSSTAPCDGESPEVPLSIRTPPIASLSIEFPPSESQSNESPALGSPSLDTPSIGTPSIRTPSVETLSMCTPRLGMLSVGLSPERMSPVDTPPADMSSPIESTIVETIDAINGLKINCISTNAQSSEEVSIEQGTEPTSNAHSPTDQASVPVSNSTEATSSCETVLKDESPDRSTSNDVALKRAISSEEISNEVVSNEVVLKEMVSNEAVLKGEVLSATVSIDMPPTDGSHTSASTNRDTTATTASQEMKDMEHIV